MAMSLETTRPHKRKIDDDDDEKPIIAKTPTDLQRLRLEKLMKHPDKPVPIPERPKEKSMPHVPDFVRNVMGSSAGAGSGEFHVYRHLRRKEYARQKFIQEKAEKETKNDDYHRKLEENKKLAEEKTAKKRAKRQKRKQKMKQNRKNKPANNSSKTNEPETEESNSDEEETQNEEQSGNVSFVNKKSSQELLNEKENSSKGSTDGANSHSDDEKQNKKGDTVTHKESRSDDTESD